jgi:hypothetical protein
MKVLKPEPKFIIAMAARRDSGARLDSVIMPTLGRKTS